MVQDLHGQIEYGLQAKKKNYFTDLEIAVQLMKYETFSYGLFSNLPKVHIIILRYPTHKMKLCILYARYCVDKTCEMEPDSSAFLPQIFHVS